jgi:hypothetical protein
MNREDIIRIAKEAGIDAESDTLCQYEGFIEPLARFASLVAAAEREACAEVCDELFADVPAYSAPDCAAAIRARSNAE